MPGVQAVQEALQAESKAEVRKLPAHALQLRCHQHAEACKVFNGRRPSTPPS